MYSRDITLLFADVSGSSRLYKDIGDAAARALVAEAVARMCASVDSHGGMVVKTIGDEVMARFDLPEQAVQAAVAMQRLADTPIDGHLLPLRIGVHAGPALLENGDVFGEVVNDAAALARIARARQIVTSAGLAGRLPAPLARLCTLFDRVTLKGNSEEEDLLLVHWEAERDAGHATMIMGVPPLPDAQDQQRLRLRHQGRELEITPAQMPFAIGRDPARCHLCVDSVLVSRDHCGIEFRRGRFVLVDRSTNGTYIDSEAAPGLYLRREELPLAGQGRIGLGQPPGSDPALTLEYWCP